MEIDRPFPEIGASTDPKAVPWHDAVVWSDRVLEGRRVYEWLPKEHIRSVSWTAGCVSIHISEKSFLERDLMFLILQAPFIAVGRNIPI